MESFIDTLRKEASILWIRVRTIANTRVPTLRVRPVHYTLAGGFVLCLAAGYMLFLFHAPTSFARNTEVTVPEGSSLRQVTEILYERGAIRSAFIFQTIVHLKNGERGIRAGVYLFPRRLSAMEIADALTTGLYQVPPTRITIFEGMRVKQIADILEHEHGIDRETFVALAEPYEGYLFPDTYFIPLAYDEESILELMLDTYQEKIETVREKIARSGLTEAEPIILASILEREARSEESMRMVAGILRKRLELGMPLQVDAAFEYILGKSSAELTRKDLAIESPYNTYTNIGLPPSPIANPGLQSIQAVLNPIESEYLFYLTSPDGVFHYAKTYQQHKRNKDLHL